jgi:DNA-binding transcriptional regulator GbsR (MarR family)
MSIPNADPLNHSVISLAGEIAEMFSFNRSIGQLYGLLYISSDPLSLEEIAKSCHMSKGNASIHLRTLENWNAVQRSCKPGTRKDYYEANTDLRGLALKRLQEGMAKRIDLMKQKLITVKQSHGTLHSSEPTAELYVQKRLHEIDALLSELERGFALLPKLIALKSLIH